MDINYIGEHLAIGVAGNILVIASFVFALLATFSYFIAGQKQDNSWGFLGKIAFWAHSLSVLSVIGLLFYMLTNHFFEYHFIWQHTSLDMSKKFLFAAFWEGQEGSFLLWSFWHVIIGNILIFTAKKWEYKVMAVFSSAQVFLSSMILGVFIFDVRIGSNPFTELLRNHPDFMQLPMFANANYLEFLDGRGLNPLLQNYCMTIHPPTLFLGFALTLVPFTYAIASLWQKDYYNWLKPALPWTFFGIGILGLGILMGGAWAYEALSFGGFWAWDPVENASLVPWLTLVAAGHLMLIQKNKGTSLFTMYFLVIISFFLVLYSTFLTRSGILGDTSVHAFTDLGMSGQLLIFLLFYGLISIFLLAVNFSSFPKNKQEEPLWSREFWMFLGGLVLLISAFQITFSTSTPVINKLFGTNLAPPANPIEHYNAWQLPFAILVLFFMGFAQFLKYRNNAFAVFLKKIFLSLGLSLVLTLVLGFSLQIVNPFFLIMLLAGLFAVIGNFEYWIRIFKGKIPKAGASIAHIGFGLLMLGALISMSGSWVLSSNSSGVDITQLGNEYNNNENILLMKGDTLPMGNYFVTYKGKKKEGFHVKFEVEYLKKTENNNYQSAFVLNPFVQLNDRMGNVPEPDTKHFLHQDIYTHVTYAILENVDEKPTEYKEPTEQVLAIGDTIYATNAILILEQLVRGVANEKISVAENILAVTAIVKVYDFNTKTHFLKPVFTINPENKVESFEDWNDDLGLKIVLQNIDPETEKVTLILQESKAKQRDFIIMKAVLFPYINILWLGCVIMVVGTFISAVNRFKLMAKK